jgi:hypothetical protein
MVKDKYHSRLRLCSNYSYNSSLTQKKIVYFAFVLAALLPSVFAFYLTISAGEIAINDYWGIMEKVFSLDGFSTDLSDWLINQNGHIVFIPRIIYAVNFILTSGSNIGLTLTTWFFALLQMLLLISLLPNSIQNHHIKFIMVLSIGAFCFTPSDADNWTQGYSGVHWIGANLLAVASITCLIRYFGDRRIWGLFGSLLLAIAAIFTYGTSFALWLALSSGILFIGRRPKLGLLFAGFTIIVINRYISNYGTQSKQITSLFENITVLTHYVLTYLGAIFTTNKLMASLLGVVGLLLALWLMTYVMFNQADQVRLELFPWSLILIYAIGNAIITALNRSNFGIEQAMMSRYASLPALFWLSIIIIGMYYLYHIIPKWFSGLFYLAFAVVGMLILGTYSVGITTAKEFFHKKSIQPVTMLSVNLGIPDEFIFPYSITTAPAQFLNLIPALKKYKHIPFNRSLDGTCGEIGQIIPKNSLEPAYSEKLRGSFDFMDGFTADGARVVGWVSNETANIECVTLLNDQNIIRGLTILNFARPDMVQTFNLPYQNVGWVGYAQITSTDEILTAYAKLKGDTSWIALNNTHSLESPGHVDRSIYSLLFLNSF